jgi:phenol 2-monooxygenase
VKVATGHADGIQPRTIEVFQVGSKRDHRSWILTDMRLQSYGLAERLLKEGNQMHLAVRENLPFEYIQSLTKRDLGVL